MWAREPNQLGHRVCQIPRLKCSILPLRWLQPADSLTTAYSLTSLKLLQVSWIFGYWLLHWKLVYSSSSIPLKLNMFLAGWAQLILPQSTCQLLPAKQCFQNHPPLRESAELSGRTSSASPQSQSAHCSHCAHLVSVYPIATISHLGECSGVGHKVSNMIFV